MNTQHETSFTKAILGSAQRLFRSNSTHSLLASHHIDAHTMKDIGISQLA